MAVTVLKLRALGGRFRHDRAAPAALASLSLLQAAFLQFPDPGHSEHARVMSSRSQTVPNLLAVAYLMLSLYIILIYILYIVMQK